MANTVSRPELLIDGNDEFFRSTIHDALGFAVRLQDVRNQLGDSIGLTGPSYSILIALDHLSRQSPVGISAISAHLHLSGPFVTIGVNKLVKSGLIEKKPDPADGRRVVLKVTTRGMALLSSLTMLQQEVNDTIFAAMDREEFRQFSANMGKLLKGLEEALALMYLRSQQRRQG